MQSTWNHLCNHWVIFTLIWVNTLRQRQNGRHFADDLFKCIFLNENVWMSSIEISLKFVPKCWINNIPALVQMMAWRRPGDKPLSEPMMVIMRTSMSPPLLVKGPHETDRHTAVYVPQIVTNSYNIITVPCNNPPGHSFESPQETKNHLCPL